MNRYISSALVDKVRSASDIIEVASQYMSIKKTGINYKGLCPFHHEKTPSFVISPEKQIFHCFGCGVGGNVINFVMQIDNISFTEAVQYLGDKYNIPVDAGTHKNNNDLSIRDNIYRSNRDALKYFQKTLLNSSYGSRSIEYLKKRGISKKTIELFSLGYAAPLWDGLLKFLNKGKGTNHDLLLKAGLVKKREGGSGCYDVFRGRIIFPIFDIQNRVIGFGGRSITDSERNLPKYINTPETPVYIKGKHLFGLHLTKDFIRSEKSVIIVEGYMDIITAYQHGIKNIVAALGTAMTVEQVQLLKRYAEEAVIVFDGDNAGEKAAERGFYNLFVIGGMRVKVVALPQDSDPDSFVRNNGREKFLEKVRDSKPFMEYIIDKIAAGVKNEEHPETQIVHINKLLGLLADIPNIVERTGYISLISEKTGISDKAILKELERAALQGKKKIDMPKYPEINKEKILAEYVLVQLMLLNEEKIEEIKEFIEPDDFEDPDLSEVARALLVSQDKNFSISNIVNSLHEYDCRIANLASRLAMEKVEFDDIDKTVKDCIKKIRNRKLRVRMDMLIQKRKKIAKDGSANREEYNKLQREYNYIRKEMRM